MYAIFNVVMTCIYWELATKVDSEMHIGVVSTLAMLYSSGSKNSNICSRVGRSLILAVYFVHSSLRRVSKSSNASAARNCDKVAAFMVFMAS